MKTQVKHWLQATAAVVGLTLLFNAMNIYNDWQLLSTGQAELEQQGIAGSTWSVIREDVLVIGCEMAGALALLALTQVIGRRLLQGRFMIPVGVVLLLIGAAVGSWFEFDGLVEGNSAVLFGWDTQLMYSAMPMAAGAWMLRDRRPAAVPLRARAEFTGSWESALGMLELEPGALFTLYRSDGEPVSGAWQLRLGAAPEVTLEVVAATDLGHGRQSTALAVEHAEGGQVRLRVDDDTVFTKVEPEQDDELMLEATHGYVGQVEVLEA